jgi:tRNA(Arg) A34 adenosine deaminase TadA
MASKRQHTQSPEDENKGGQTDSESSSNLNLNNMESSSKRQCTQSPEDENKGGQTDTESSRNLSFDEDNQSGNPGYAKSYSRVSKEDLYMIIALWMEDFVDDPPEGYNKVGAVLVLPNDVIFAADCSRDGVHAVARLLMKHYDKAKGCKMFMSRKPCPICAKLLVQSKVQRVLFLPFEPEYYPSNDNDSMMKQVDSLFTASAIAQTRFVLQVDETVLKDAQLKTPSPSKIKTRMINEEKKSLVDKYGFEKNLAWKKSIVEKLPWPSFDSDTL